MLMAAVVRMGGLAVRVIEVMRRRWSRAGIAVQFAVMVAAQVDAVSLHLRLAQLELLHVDSDSWRRNAWLRRIEMPLHLHDIPNVRCGVVIAIIGIAVVADAQRRRSRWLVEIILSHCFQVGGAGAQCHVRVESQIRFESVSRW